MRVCDGTPYRASHDARKNARVLAVFVLLATSPPSEKCVKME
jgi:hypothetical protein